MRFAARAVAASVSLALPLALCGCGGADVPPPEIYAPLHYEYLPKLRLNVGTIEVTDQSHPLGAQDIASTSPVVPARALAQMAHDRLFASALAGTAHFVIDQASIVRQPDGSLSGDLAVHLDILTPGGTRGGYMAAQVVSQHIPGSDPENEQNVLYDLTKKMMSEMNVEFEFQLRKNLSSWLVTGAALPTAVQAQPLYGQPLPPEMASPAPPAAAPTQPPATNDLDQAPGAPPQDMSPPAGYLQPPPGVPPPEGY